jgi:hypothetical protein
MMEAASTFETSINFYQNKRRNNPADSYPKASNYLARGLLTSDLNQGN